MIPPKLAIATGIRPLHRQSSDNDADNKKKSMKENEEKAAPSVIKPSPPVKKSLSESVRENIAQSACKSSQALSSFKGATCSNDKSPVQLLREIFARNGSVIPTAASGRCSNGRFRRPTKEEMNAYDNETCRAVRSGDLNRIQDLYHKEGKSLNGCNQFGESLLHMACRRGCDKVVEFMLKEANVETANLCDDMGRNVLHDAMWTSKPNFNVVDILLEYVSPELMLMPDIRGHTPFDYARKNHWEVWCNYLVSREDKLQRRLAIVNSMVALTT